MLPWDLFGICNSIGCGIVVVVVGGKFICIGFGCCCCRCSWLLHVASGCCCPSKSKMMRRLIATIVQNRDVPSGQGRGGMWAAASLSHSYLTATSACRLYEFHLRLNGHLMPNGIGHEECKWKSKLNSRLKSGQGLRNRSMKVKGAHPQQQQQRQ